MGNVDDQITRIGIAGYGLMGRVFAGVARTLPWIDVVGVAETDAGSRARAEAECGCKTTGSLDELLETVDADALMITAPEEVHEEMVLRGLEAGKPVFVEKPLAPSVRAANAMVEAAEARRGRVAVGHCLRFDPAYGRARAAVSEGRIGSVVHVAARRNTSVGDAERLAGRVSIVDYLGIHDIDILHWVTGLRIVSVSAQGCRSRMERYGVDDAVQALLRFDNGAVGTLESSWLRPRAATSAWSSSLAVWGTEGAIEVTPCAAAVTVADGEGASSWNQGYITETGVQGDIAGIYRDEMLNFAQFVRGDAEAGCTAKEALEAVRVAEAIKTSVAGAGTTTAV